MGPQDITTLLKQWGAGDRDAMNRLFPLVYEELQRMARGHFAGERSGHTLQSTALVHELYLRIADGVTTLQDRRHFFAVTSRQMRRLLIDHARAAQAEKGGGALTQVELSDSDGAS